MKSPSVSGTEVNLTSAIKWGMGLLGVVACLTGKIADEFDAYILHQFKI